MASAAFVGAQPIQTICSFTNSANPNGLMLGNDGNFYGTTETGGITNAAYPQGMGTVFQVTFNGTLTTLADFTNGAFPNGLTLGSDGNFYGTTPLGGLINPSYFPQGMGTVFQVTTNGTLTTLASFNFTNGVHPNQLTLGNDGNFYGTTSYGGISNSRNFDGMGTVFQVTTNGTLTTLASFNFTNGAYPQNGLTLGNDGNFYGTTEQGGITNSAYPYGRETVFQVTTNGTLTTLADFTNEAYPNQLTLGNDGNFYGTTSEGGITNSAHPSGMGTVFQVTTDGTMTTLACFNSINGSSPSGLTPGNDGNFYGTTSSGGDSGIGTVFQVTTNGTLTTFASFNSTTGANPQNGLTLGNDGNFYGTTEGGGITNSAYPYGMGTVFRVLPSLAFTVQPQSQTIDAGATATSATAWFSMAKEQHESRQWRKHFGRNQQHFDHHERFRQ
jgi:uncharacterized repeat protein (TIGR03803 family)